MFVHTCSLASCLEFNCFLGFSCTFLMYVARLEASILVLSCNGRGNKSIGAIGLNPYTISKGHILVLECSSLLYANSTCGKHSSQTFRFFFTFVRSNIDNVRFTFLYFTMHEKCFDELNPFGMTTVQFCLSFQVFQSFMIRVNNKFFWP